MPTVINDIKLDFKDVLLRPKRSTLKSRSDVDLYREITFRHSKQTYNGIPVTASNMETIGTFEIATVLAKYGFFTILHKYYTIEEWKEFADKHPDCIKYTAATSGTGVEDLERLKCILNAVPEIAFMR
ncbi:GMP reductase 2-like [Leptopilina boulardi]|uniref:GMP reductase 2-like n=1 Tax=Leptopilina boulardi TaxID=63433 RepID=UPI0021F585C0|nr:GMP reductase 2-like [Leptopilina boulardi]